jgi:phasin family protein
MKNKPMTEITEAATKGFEQSVSTLKDSAAQASASVAEAQTKIKDGMEKAMKTAEEMVAFSQGTFEAFTKSSQIWTAGVQDISKEVAASAQASMDETVGMLKALTSVKSLKEAMELQSSLVKSAFEKAMAHGGKFTEASVKLTEHAMAPITARVTLAVEKFAKTA